MSGCTKRGMARVEWRENRSRRTCGWSSPSSRNRVSMQRPASLLLNFVADGFCRGGGFVLPFAGIFKDSAHEAAEMVDIRLGPHGAFRIRAGGLLNRDQLVVYEIAVPIIHEVGVAGVARRDDRFSQIHRLGQIESEAFAPMRRHEAIERVVKRRGFICGELTVEYLDVGRS